MWQRWKGCGVYGGLSELGERGPLRTTNQIKRKKWYTTKTGRKPFAKGSHIHDNTVKHGGLFTSLLRGEVGNNSLVLTFIVGTKGIFFSFSRERSQQWSGHGEERRFHKSSTKRRDRKKRQPSTFSELMVYKTRA